MHIQLLKAYTPRQEGPRVPRVTSVLEPDTVTDQLDDQYIEAKVTGSVVTDSREKDIRSWEEYYKDILTKEPGLTKLKQFKIDTGNHAPIHQRPYNTPQSLMESVNKELEWLKSKGYIRPSESPWSSPMVTVHKPDGTARLCVDFKAIYAVTEPILFYMPQVEEVLESMGKSTIISKLHLTKGYYQVPMHPNDIQKPAFMCHQGRFEFLRMLFGVNKAPAVFQELMQGLIRDCSFFCSPYMDDLVIFSSNWEDHVQHVRQVLDKLRTAGLMASPAKCHWVAPGWNSWVILSGRAPCPFLSTRSRLLLNIPNRRQRKRSLGPLAFTADTLNFWLSRLLYSPLSLQSWLPPRFSGLRSVSWLFHPYVHIFPIVVPCVFLSRKTSFLLLQMPPGWA